MAHEVDASVSPLGAAIIEMLERLVGDLGTRPAGSIRVYVFGGCAVHLLTQARGSNDLDAEISAMARYAQEVTESLLSAPIYYDDNGRQRALVFDPAFNTTLCPLHEDYPDRAIPLRGLTGDCPVHAYIASAADVAISKLGRYTRQDKADILALMRLGHWELDEFEQLATTAIQFCAIQSPTTAYNLREVLAELRGGDNGA